MFADFEELGDEVINLLDPADSLALVAGLRAIVITWVTLYIMYMGYMVLFGKLDTPIRHVIYKLLLFAFIGLFAFNIDGWFYLVTNGIDGLSNWISGGGTNTIYAELDAGIVTIGELSDTYWEYDDAFGLLALAGSVIIYLSYLAVALSTALLVLINSITLKIAFIIAPFAFVSLFFPKIRGIFDRWVEIIISNIFTIFFLALFSEVIFDKYRDILSNLNPVTITPGLILNSSSVDILTSAFTIFSFSALGVVLLFMATQLASRLSSVSIESIPKSAIFSTVMSSYVLGKGYSAGKSVGKSVGKSGVDISRKSIAGLSRVSTKVGNAGSNAHSLLKKTGNAAKAERASGKK